MSRVVVDPRWAQQMRHERTTRGLTLRQLGALTSYSHTYLWELETGRKRPGTVVAQRIDEALAAGGRLAALVDDQAAAVDPDERDRLEHVVAVPRTIDAAAVAALGGILDHQRRLEDTIGSGALVAPVVAQLTVVENLVIEARGPIRADVVNVAAEWAQFAGWLHAAAGQPDRARDWYARALEWATETGNVDMIATALSMRGHLAWQARQPGPLIGLSAAALRLPASPGVRALAAQQEARGHALAGEGDDVDRRLDDAAELAAASAGNRDREPPWIYFYNGDYLAMQRGLAYRLLGREVDAIEHLQAGLAAMPARVRRSEWVGAYLVQLALAHHAAGNPDEAARAVDEIRAVAAATGSEQLTRQVNTLARRFGL